MGGVRCRPVVGLLELALTVCLVDIPLCASNGLRNMHVKKYEKVDVSFIYKFNYI